ncbi:MAG: glycosyltransferase 87 family protein [Corynebacterium sp.]|nr:glycosyltransferase 87 family protein [Corynebacterium sp.]
MSDPARRVQPAETQPVAQGFIEFLGGRMGRHSVVGTARWFTPLRVLYMVGSIFLVFAYLAKSRCLFGKYENGVWSLDWSGSRQYVAACYNDIVPLYGAEGLAAGHFPYLYSWVENGQTRYMEYPVLSGLYQWVIAFITRHTYGILPFPFPEVTWYFALTALSLSVFWFIIIRWVYILSGNKAWDVILMVASPLVVMHAFSNWDIFSIFFAVGALLALKRYQYVRAGIFIGLGVAAKLWPLFLLGALLVEALRNREWRQFIITTLSTVVTWVAVNAPIYLLSPAGWREFLRLNSERGWEWTTIYAVIYRIFGVNLSGSTLNMLSFALFALACVAILILGLKRPDLNTVQIFFLITAAFLFFNKVWSPQYSIWLLPLAVLAVPQWRLIWVWTFTEAILWPVLTWHMMGTDHKGVTAGFLNVFILIRDVMLIIVVTTLIRRKDSHADHVPGNS